MKLVALAKPLFCIGGLLALSACAAITPFGLAAASRLDPLNTAPNDITLAISVPNAVRLADGDASFRIAFQEEGADPEVYAVEESAALILRTGETDLPSPPAPGKTVYAARFAEKDVARIAAAQARIRKLRANGVEGSGSISVAIVGGCSTGGELESLPFSSWLKTGAERGYVRLTSRLDALAFLDPERADALRGQIGACDDAAARGDAPPAALSMVGG